jgi:WD40 repeat protein
MESTTRFDFPGKRPVWWIDVVFSGNGRYLAAAAQTVNWFFRNASKAQGYAVVWDLRAPSAPPVRVSTGTGVDAVALSPDGRTLYAGWPLTAYDVASGDAIWQRSELTATYTAVEVRAEGDLLAMAGQNPNDCARDGLLVRASDGATVRRLRGQRSPACDIRFSPDGKLVGSISVRGEIIVWETATGQVVERFNTGDPQGLGFGRRNDLVFGGGRDSMLRTWDLSAHDTYLQYMTQVGTGEVFTHADFSPDGGQVAFRSLDARDNEWVRFLDVATERVSPPTRFPAQPSPWPMSAWHPDGGQYVGWCARAVGDCQEHGVITVVDPSTGQTLLETRDIVDGDGDIHGVAYVDGGRRLVVGTSDGETTIFDAETLQPSAGPFDYGADGAATIGDGSSAAVSETIGDGTFEHWRLVDVSTGEVRSEWETNLAYAVAASPDGSTLAVAGQAGEVVTVDVASGDQQRRSTSVGAWVYWLNYSDDGELLVSGAADGGVSLWDAVTLDHLGTVYPPNEGSTVPSGAQFIGDTHDVAIASYDGRVYRWDTDLDRAIDFACQMAGRTLTEDEWDAYLPGQPYQDVCPGLGARVD